MAMVETQVQMAHAQVTTGMVQSGAATASVSQMSFAAAQFSFSGCAGQCAGYEQQASMTQAGMAFVAGSTQGKTASPALAKYPSVQAGGFVLQGGANPFTPQQGQFQIQGGFMQGNFPNSARFAAQFGQFMMTFAIAAMMANALQQLGSLKNPSQAQSGTFDKTDGKDDTTAKEQEWEEFFKWLDEFGERLKEIFGLKDVDGTDKTEKAEDSDKADQKDDKNENKVKLSDVPPVIKMAATFYALAKAMQAKNNASGNGKNSDQEYEKVLKEAFYEFLNLMGYKVDQNEK